MVHVRTIRVAVVDAEWMIRDALAEGIIGTSPDIHPTVSVNDWRDLEANPHYPVDVVLLCLDCCAIEPLGPVVEAATARGIKVLLYARRTPTRALRSALPAGADGFISTTEPLSALIRAIHDVASGGSYLSAAVTELLAREVQPRLSQQERRVLRNYAAGATVPEVAARLNISVETTKSYLKRVREKYRSVGIDVGTKVALHQQALSEGLLDDSTGLLTTTIARPKSRPTPQAPHERS